MSIDDRIENALKKLRLNRFSPYPTLRSGWMQTIAGFYLPFLKASAPTSMHVVTLADGDQVLVAENRPKSWKSGQRIVLLVHGVTGCYQSNYMQRMARRLSKRGILVLRLNLRNAGTGLGLAKRPYHAGISDDTREILRWIEKNYPESKVTQIGFSMGSNITLKMAGEDGSRPTGPLDSIVAVSPPLDLKKSSEKMSSSENRIFQKFFIKHLIKDIKKLHQKFPELGPVNLDPNMSFLEFDQQYTAPVAGYSSAAEYYKSASSIAYLHDIKVPTLIIGAADDPVAETGSLIKATTRDNIDLLLTKHGGHMGFLGFGTTWDEIRWSDQAIAQWIQTLF